MEFDGMAKGIGNLVEQGVGEVRSCGCELISFFKKEWIYS